VQATASANMRVSTGSITLASGGTGYTAGDVLTFSGGTFATAAQITVNTVSAGVIATFTVTNAGVTYTALPANPVSVTGGTGSGATFNASWAVQSVSITNAGSGYVEQPTVTFSGGGGSGAAAYAQVGSDTLIRSLGQNIAFTTPNGRTGFRVIDFGGATGTGYWNALGGTTGPQLRATGSTSAVILAESGVPIQFSTASLEQFRVAHTASAVNYVQVTGAATGARPTISAQGSDANAGLWLQTKGTGNFRFDTRAGASINFLIADSGAAVNANWLQATGAATGANPVLSAQGSDTNIPLVLQPKGTGALQAQQTDSTATGGNARGANAVDWQTSRNAATAVASGSYSVVGGGTSNTASGVMGVVVGGQFNIANGQQTGVLSGYANSAGTSPYSAVVGGFQNTAAGYLNFIGGGQLNSATSATVVTTQSATMNATTAVTLSGSNASIKVGQYITGTSIATNTYVAAISGTSLTLSQAASGSSTSTLSFYTPHGVVVGGGNNQATGSYSFIGGGGDAGTAANRNVASGDFSVVCGGNKNTASGLSAFVGGGGVFSSSTVLGTFPNTASGISSVVVGGLNNTASGQSSFIGSGYNNLANSTYGTVAGGTFGTTRGIIGNNAIACCNAPFGGSFGIIQTATLLLGRQTTGATATVLTSDSSGASTNNQVILPNNSAYYFRGEVVSGVTGGGNTKGWFIEGVIKRGANAASTALVGTPTVTSLYADAGAATWTIAVTADTTNGGLAVTFTGQAGTTIRTVCQVRTTEMTF